MKNFLPLIILLLIIVLFSILAFQSSKIIEGNTNQSSAGGPCVYSDWSTTGTCTDGKIEQTRTVTSGDSASCTDTTKEIDCQVAGSSSTNLASSCTRPVDLTGYEFSQENLSMSNFEISGLKCAENYYGNPTADACTTAGSPYSINGCNRIMAQVNTGEPQHIILNFSKDIHLLGDGEELKNNFEVKIISNNFTRNISTNNKFITAESAMKETPTKIKLKIGARIQEGETVVVKYQQNKLKSDGGVELKIGDVKMETIDEITVVNNIKDTEAPVFETAIISNEHPNKIVVTFNEHLIQNDALTLADFQIKVNDGRFRYPNKASTYGKSLMLDIRQTIQKGNRVVFKYTPNPSDDSKHIKDLKGNAIGNLEEYVVNNVGYPAGTAVQETEEKTEETESKENAETLLQKALQTGMSIFAGNSSTLTESEKKKVLSDVFNIGRSAGVGGHGDEKYYNRQYVKSMGAHNPFNFLNRRDNIRCKLDPQNKNKAICNLNRNKPIRALNINELEDNRGDEKDKYMLKTQIVPVVYPRCPTCNDDDDDGSSGGILGNVFGGGKNKTSSLFPKIKKVKLEDNFKTGNPLQLNKSIEKIMDVQDNLQLDKYNRTTKSKNSTGLQLNDGLNIPSINPSAKKGMEQITTQAADMINVVPPKFSDENEPTQLTQERANLKATPSNRGGFIPRLTSFSAF